MQGETTEWVNRTVYFSNQLNKVIQSFQSIMLYVSFHCIGNLPLYVLKYATIFDTIYKCKWRDEGIKLAAT